MSYTPLPTPPTRQDPTNFADRGDEFLAALPLFQQELNAMAEDVSDDADAAAQSALDATTNGAAQVALAAAQVTLAENQVDLAEIEALAAAQSALDAQGFVTDAQNYANAAATSAASVSPAWVSGTTYAIGDLVYSPINFKTYRRITAGAGTTDPSLDTTNWLILSGGSSVGADLYLWAICV